MLKEQLREKGDNAMATAKKHYSRYYIVRDNASLWNGDPLEQGTKFRQLLITSNEFNWTNGVFQLYGLEATSKGIIDGGFETVEKEPILIFDEDFHGLEKASKKLEELLDQARQEGYGPMSTMDMLEFDSKLKRS